MGILSNTFFVNNRQKLIESLGADGLIIVPGNGLLQRSADTSFRFRQDSNFFYLTGIEEPNSTLVIDTKSSKSFVMMPIRRDMHAIFDGTQDIKKLMSQSGVDEIIDEKAGWQRLKTVGGKQIFMPQKPVARLDDIYTNPHRAAVYAKVRRMFGVKPIDIRPNLADLRVIKSSAELDCIKKAVQITLKGIDETLQQAANITTEYQLEAELTKQFNVSGASGHAYAPIVASGESSCTLHYIKNDAKLSNGHIVLLDVGAEYNNYAADISRTIVWGQQPSARQNAVIESVSVAQKQIIELLKPGLVWQDFARQADEIVAKQLRVLGLINKTYTTQDVRQYFPHAVSHFLGLDVHDVGDYSKPLQDGMVITVEPGIYINSEKIGVRIEDDVLITDNGAQIIN